MWKRLYLDKKDVMSPCAKMPQEIQQKDFDASFFDVHVESCNTHHASRFTHHASRITRMWSRSFSKYVCPIDFASSLTHTSLFHVLCQHPYMRVIGVFHIHRVLLIVFYFSGLFVLVGAVLGQCHHLPELLPPHLFFYHLETAII